MSEKARKKSSKEKADKKRHKKSHVRSSENSKSEKDDTVAKSTLSLLADDARIDPTLSSLFASKPTPPVRKSQISTPALQDVEDDSDDGDIAEERDQPSSLKVHDQSEDHLIEFAPKSEANSGIKRKRKRKDAEDEIEDVYMRRLAQEEAREAEVMASERTKKRQKVLSAPNGHADSEVNGGAESDGVANAEITGHSREDVLENDMSPPPLHETEQAPDVELAKANRTVFLGNVSTTAIASKAARKTLLDHLKAFFPQTSTSTSKPQSNEKETKHKIESLRFRSTPYAPASGPKKASFAKKEVMDATTKSTNAYVVFSSAMLAREAVKHLNGTIVLDRHLRVDSVAHPTPVDHRRCVFVGGLSFVDDESNMQSANEEPQRKRPKQPADIEEGLWRTFGKCGNVESVRVIRDNATRVGKGIAYVQFEDANAVEAALLYDGKKFPPMLPRTLRVSRAKAVKRNKEPRSKKPNASVSGSQRQVSGVEASKMGRARKLLGRAAATSQAREMGRSERRPGDEGGNGVKRTGRFVFEGHRASSKGGKSGLRLGKKKSGKPTNRSAKRGAAFKAGKGK